MENEKDYEVIADKIQELIPNLSSIIFSSSQFTKCGQIPFIDGTSNFVNELQLTKISSII